MSVYFIRNRSTGNYKIGFSTDPEYRLQTLQTGCEDPLELVLILEGTKDRERAIQDSWRHLRLRGEWFRADHKLEVYITAERIKQAAYRQTGVAGLNTFNRLVELVELDPGYEPLQRLWLRLVLSYDKLIS